jgi:hypothetical protein
MRMKRPKNIGKGARQKLREYFLAHVGEVLDAYVLRKAAGGITEWARRVRELRQLEGMNIKTDKDDSSLKPGQYRLVDTKPLPVFESGISKETRAFVLDRNGFTCQMCGAAAGEPHPTNPNMKTRLHIGHIKDLSDGGTNDYQNLRALCSVCNEGAQNITLPRPEFIKLIAQVRRARGDVQLDVLKWLIKKYPAEAKKLTGESA